MALPKVQALRDRMAPPAARRPEAAGNGGGVPVEVRRLLGLSGRLFDAPAAALVLAGPTGLAVAAATERDGWSDAAIIATARGLFEALASAEPAEGGGGGVIEEVAPGCGLRAATALLSPAGRCLGAVCLGAPDRRTLLSGLQRRLFAEFGALVAAALDPAARAEAPRNGSSRLQEAAEAEPDAFALFDPEGRCLLRNARFDALVGTASLPPSLAAPSAAQGREASWIALHLARDTPPVGVYRAALADGTWLAVEERSGPQGRSLLARIEERDAFGSTGEMKLLFERCPLPMFVFERDTRAILAVNEAALALYGWDRDAFLQLDLDGIGAVAAEGGVFQGGTHRRRDGRALSVSGRAVELAHRGRPAVLVTVAAEGHDEAPRA